jgi:hypothetical protein
MVTKTLKEEIVSLEALKAHLSEEVKGLYGSNYQGKREKLKDFVIHVSSTVARLKKEELKTKVQQLTIG